MIWNPLQLHMTPGTVAWCDNQLCITPPVLVSTSSQASPGDQPDSRFDKIIMMDVNTLDGANVMVLKNGTPDKFYCKLVSTASMLEEDVIERTLGTLLDHEIQEVSPSPGQGVIVWYKGRWHRASLIGFYEGGWRCELVDIGMMVERIQKVKQMPSSLLDIPAKTIQVSLVGVEDVGCWTILSMEEWKRMTLEPLQATVANIQMKKIYLHSIDRTLPPQNSLLSPFTPNLVASIDRNLPLFSPFTPNQMASPMPTLESPSMPTQLYPSTPTQLYPSTPSLLPPFMSSMFPPSMPSSSPPWLSAVLLPIEPPVSFPDQPTPPLPAQSRPSLPSGIRPSHQPTHQEVTIDIPENIMRMTARVSPAARGVLLGKHQS